MLWLVSLITPLWLNQGLKYQISVDVKRSFMVSKSVVSGLLYWGYPKYRQYRWYYMIYCVSVAIYINNDIFKSSVLTFLCCKQNLKASHNKINCQIYVWSMQFPWGISRMCSVDVMLIVNKNNSPIYRTSHICIIDCLPVFFFSL